MERGTPDVVVGTETGAKSPGRMAAETTSASDCTGSGQEDAALRAARSRVARLPVPAAAQQASSHSRGGRHAAGRAAAASRQRARRGRPEPLGRGRRRC
ncbi:hypothetical protein [Paenibacillus sp. P32E]|uniref:hypothetical protein n=1 Tax=Paenibacillus sp. P32E TaxID=1349434 RepID=UPI002116E30E|nr:hypothetical protein [Paenibacillus sp. P32E]